MTLDEAIKHAEEVAEEQENKFSISGEYLGNNADCQKCAEEHRQLAEWLKDYKRLLEQEPTDAVSREAVDKYIVELLSGYLYDEERERLEKLSAYLWELPSVTQKPGEWDNSCTCSACGRWRILESEKNGGKYKYCPNCGCAMFEPQESEDKE